MDPSSAAAMVFVLARPLSWGVAIGSSIGCFVGILTARMQTALSNARRSTPSDSEAGVPLRATRLVPVVASCGESDDPEVEVEADLQLLEPMKQKMQDREFLRLLRNLVGESWHLRNDPVRQLVPEERNAATLVRDELDCFAQPRFGPLQIDEFEYEPGRTNLRITYPATHDHADGSTVTFMGAHFDVLPGVPRQQKKTPDDGCTPLGIVFGLGGSAGSDMSCFQLEQQEEKLFGRGTSSCLGHVALLTQFLCELARAKPRLRHTIVVIFLAGQEGGEANVGADRLLEKGVLEDLKNGPVFWLDVGDSRLCCSSTGSLGWTLKAVGHESRSDFCHKGVNSSELAWRAFTYIQKCFSDTFPPNEEDSLYHFVPGTTSMKPQRIEYHSAETCPEMVMSGDIRFTPSHGVIDVMEAVEGFVRKFNEEPGSPGQVKLTWTGRPTGVSKKAEEQQDDALQLALDLEGIAVRKDTSYRALAAAFRQVCPGNREISVTGSIPHARRLQKHGFDVQLCGFGKLDQLHDEAEHCSLSDMRDGYEVLFRVVCLLEKDIRDRRPAANLPVPASAAAAVQREEVALPANSGEEGAASSLLRSDDLAAMNPVPEQLASDGEETLKALEAKDGPEAAPSLAGSIKVLLTEPSSSSASGPAPSLRPEQSCQYEAEISGGRKLHLSYRCKVKIAYGEADHHLRATPCGQAPGRAAHAEAPLEASDDVGIGLTLPPQQATSRGDSEVVAVMETGANQPSEFPAQQPANASSATAPSPESSSTFAGESLPHSAASYTLRPQDSPHSSIAEAAMQGNPPNQSSTDEHAGSQVFSWLTGWIANPLGFSGNSSGEDAQPASAAAALAAARYATVYDVTTTRAAAASNASKLVITAASANVLKEHSANSPPDSARSTQTEEGALVDETITDTAPVALTEADSEQLQQQDSRTADLAETETAPRIVSGASEESQAGSLSADVSEAQEGPLTAGSEPLPLHSLTDATHDDATSATGSLEGSPVDCRGSQGTSPSIWDTQLVPSSSASNVNDAGSAVAHEDMDMDMVEYLQSMPIHASSHSLSEAVLCSVREDEGVVEIDGEPAGACACPGPRLTEHEVQGSIA